MLLVYHLLTDLVLAGFMLSLYHEVLHSPFVFDDLTILNNLSFMRRIDPLTNAALPGIVRGTVEFFRQFRTHTGGVVALFRARPITRLSYELNVMSGGLNPYHYHLTSLGVGIAAVITFRHVLLHFAGWPAAFLGAMVLASAPLATMSVAYIAGRSSLLAALFVLLAVACYLNGWAVACGIMVVMGLGTKEEGIAALPILMYMHYGLGV